MRSVVLLLAVGALLSACGVPSDPSEQAAEVASIAAEGALLAGDAEAGDSTSAFVRVHAQALLERLETLEPEIAEPALERVAREAAGARARLAEDPSERGSAATLEQAAKRARELAR